MRYVFFNPYFIPHVVDRRKYKGRKRGRGRIRAGNGGFCV